jgi:hypothetical protein
VIKKEARASVFYAAVIVGVSLWTAACGGGGSGDRLAGSACEAPERALAEVNAARAATVAGMACASDGQSAYWVQLFGERP